MIDLTTYTPRSLLARLFRTPLTTEGVRLAVGMCPHDVYTFWQQEERYGRPETPKERLNR